MTIRLRKSIIDYEKSIIICENSITNEFVLLTNQQALHPMDAPNVRSESILEQRDERVIKEPR